MAKIALGLSGGIDSSVAAHLLKAQGYEVIGVFMRFWHDSNPACSGCSENKCCNAESLQKIKRLCIELDMPLHIYNFEQEFKNKVVDNFINYYSHGLTPNPCIWCNEEIKFKLFYEKAAKDLNIDFIATGHYADLIQIDNYFYIKQGTDKTKDQSYFLYRIPQNILSKITFPLANLTKQEVRAMATRELSKYNFTSQKESQDLCFVTENYQEFVTRHTNNLQKSGNIINLQGELIGQHNGLINYTVGQRKGITMGGGTIYYVKTIDTTNNQLIVAEHQEMLCDQITIKNIISSPKLYQSIQPQISHPSNKLISNQKKPKKITADQLEEGNITAQIRYHSQLTKCEIVNTETDETPEKTNELLIKFHQSQFAPTPGQHGVIYQNDIIVGGGEIKK
jgi:tRNA-specific 2-thiouridylase